MSTNSIQQRYTLQAIERLKLRKQIETLFQTGEAFSVFPLRIVYRLIPLTDASGSPVQVGFSIPKKNQKSRWTQQGPQAFKRSMAFAEAPALSGNTGQPTIALLLIYTGPPLLTFEEAKMAVLKLQQKLIQRLVDSR